MIIPRYPPRRAHVLRYHGVMGDKLSVKPQGPARLRVWFRSFAVPRPVVGKTTTRSINPRCRLPLVLPGLSIFDTPRQGRWESSRT
jgi:hypothetical protein